MIDSVYNEVIRELPLYELVEIRAARKPERIEEYPFKGAMPYIDIKALESAIANRYAGATNYIIGKQDLVVVKDGYRCGKVFNAMNGVAASTLAILTPRRSDVRMDYLYCYLAYHYDDFQNRKKGLTIGHLDMQYLKLLLVPVPDVAKQSEIAEKYHRIESLASETKEKYLRLKELSILLRNKDLKGESENLNLQVEMILKSWLYQIFKKTL